MTSSKIDTLVLSKYIPLHTEIVNSPDKKRKLKKHLISVELKNLTDFGQNPRFALTEAINEKEHEQKIIGQDEVRFQNLVDSIEMSGFTTPVLVAFDPDSDKLVTLAGSRRYFASKKAGQKNILAYYYEGATEDDLVALRDWPEAHDTKVEHNNLYIGLNIYNAIEKHEVVEDRKREIVKLGKRFGLSKGRIEKFHRVTSKLVDFRTRRNQEVDANPKSYKSFETYDQIHQNEISKLREIGDFERIDTIVSLIESSIDHSIAHDDFKDSASYLSLCDHQDDLLVRINEGSLDISDKDDLRSITLEVRDRKRKGSNPVQELKKGVEKSYSILFKEYSPELMNEILFEIDKAKEKFSALQGQFQSLEREV